MSPTIPPTIVDRFAPLARDYDVLLCDVWGVVHNGAAAFAAACEALARFRAGGGTVILITNAPRPGASVQRILDRFGVARDAYDAITTSGDVTRGIVERRLDESVFHLGPPRDLPIFAGLDVTFASPQTADYVVCSGLFDDATETPDNYRELLAALRARSLFMVCANPDIVVERGDTLLYCAGALADAYVALGGEALYCGKPHAPIYQAALREAAICRGGAAPALGRVLAIGDSIRTDLKGAAAFGVDSLFVISGIHAEEFGGREAADLSALSAAFAAAGVAPKAVARRLQW
ncbi:MAG TPA: TIGR01459 family HAD-type hydrolase [Xanthobacteraceae bacterium]|nr:TIGR01459 family HAD-type hydrolase [Xanthobacteraceae bacterium]